MLPDPLSDQIPALSPAPQAESTQKPAVRRANNLVLKQSGSLEGSWKPSLHIATRSGLLKGNKSFGLCGQEMLYVSCRKEVGAGGRGRRQGHLTRQRAPRAEEGSPGCQAPPGPQPPQNRRKCPCHSPGRCPQDSGTHRGCSSVCPPSPQVPLPPPGARSENRLLTRPLCLSVPSQHLSRLHGSIGGRPCQAICSAPYAVRKDCQVGLVPGAWTPSWRLVRGRLC